MAARRSAVARHATAEDVPTPMPPTRPRTESVHSRFVQHETRGGADEPVHPVRAVLGDALVVDLQIEFDLVVTQPHQPLDDRIRAGIVGRRGSDGRAGLRDRHLQRRLGVAAHTLLAQSPASGVSAWVDQDLGR